MWHQLGFLLLLGSPSVGARSLPSSFDDDILESRIYTQSELVDVPLEKRQSMTWVKDTEYAGSTFFDGWDFFNEPDPSNGCKLSFPLAGGHSKADRVDVNYQSAEDAHAKGLAFWTEDGTPGIQADHWSHIEGDENRDSVRITSKDLFSGGLFIIDLELMPWGCGVWPAFWLLGYGAPWPTAGEIDIIEGIQAMETNQYTIHTNPGCVVNTKSGLYTGQVTNPVCDRKSGGTGCSIISPSKSSFGMPFNEAGGGVFAMLWDERGIRMWSWNRDGIPTDINDEQPSPAAWGTPDAAFDASACDPATFFSAQTLILNINLCGDWAGLSYNQYNYCPGSCRSYIQEPTNLNNTVMIVNYIRVYQLSAGPSSVIGQVQERSNSTGTGAGASASAVPTGGAIAVGEPKPSRADRGIDLSWSFGFAALAMVGVFIGCI